MQVDLSTELTFNHELYFDTANSIFCWINFQNFTRIVDIDIIGLEMKVYYLKMDMFDLYEMDIKSTIKWNYTAESCNITG